MITVKLTPNDAREVTKEIARQLGLFTFGELGCTSFLVNDMKVNKKSGEVTGVAPVIGLARFLPNGDNECSIMFQSKDVIRRKGISLSNQYKFAKLITTISQAFTVLEVILKETETEEKI